MKIIRSQKVLFIFFFFSPSSMGGINRGMTGSSNTRSHDANHRINIRETCPHKDIPVLPGKKDQRRISEYYFILLSVLGVLWWLSPLDKRHQPACVFTWKQTNTKPFFPSTKFIDGLMLLFTAVLPLSALLFSLLSFSHWEMKLRDSLKASLIPSLLF